MTIRAWTERPTADMTLEEMLDKLDEHNGQVRRLQLPGGAGSLAYYATVDRALDDVLRLSKGLRAAVNEIRMRVSEEPLREVLIERLRQILLGREAT